MKADGELQFMEVAGSPSISKNLQQHPHDVDATSRRYSTRLFIALRDHPRGFCFQSAFHRSISLASRDRCLLFWRSANSRDERHCDSPCRTHIFISKNGTFMAAPWAITSEKRRQLLRMSYNAAQREISGDEKLLIDVLWAILISRAAVAKAVRVTS